MATYKHFSLSERIDIEHFLKDGYSFKSIGKELNRDCTTIAKEVKKHITHKRSGAYGRAFNNCIHRFDCKFSDLCDKPSCKHRY